MSVISNLLQDAAPRSLRTVSNFLLSGALVKVLQEQNMYHGGALYEMEPKKKKYEQSPNRKEAVGGRLSPG